MLTGPCCAIPSIHSYHSSLYLIDDNGLVPAAEEPLDARLSVLYGTCAILTKDWWSYEWCHRKEMRQFHLNMPHGAHGAEVSVRERQNREPSVSE